MNVSYFISSLFCHIFSVLCHVGQEPDEMTPTWLFQFVCIVCLLGLLAVILLSYTRSPHQSACCVTQRHYGNVWCSQLRWELNKNGRVHLSSPVSYIDCKDQPKVASPDTAITESGTVSQQSVSAETVPKVVPVHGCHDFSQWRWPWVARVHFRWLLVSAEQFRPKTESALVLCHRNWNSTKTSL